MSEQKETVDGLRDEECGEQVQAGYAGLCKLVKKSFLSHGKKILLAFIFTDSLDSPQTHKNYFTQRKVLQIKMLHLLPESSEILWIDVSLVIILIFTFQKALCGVSGRTGQ